MGLASARHANSGVNTERKPCEIPNEHSDEGPRCGSLVLPWRVACESGTVRSVRVSLHISQLENDVSYYRDDKGLEVDVIVEYAGRWAGIEAKLSDTKVDEGAGNLLSLCKKAMSNSAARNSEPLFLAVVVGKGTLSYAPDDGVMVIPTAVLGAWERASSWQWRQSPACLVWVAPCFGSL